MISTPRKLPDAPTGARWIGCLIALILCTAVRGEAADALPPKPKTYVTDSSGFIRPDVKARLESELRDYERATSNQVLIAVFPSVPEEFAMEDFTQRTAEAWGVGQSKSDNGAVLFVFPNQRQLRIEVGYGLEGAIPDILAKQIIDQEIIPAFRAGDLSRGIENGAQAILAAARGEYQGTGRLVSDSSPTESTPPQILIFFVFFMIVVISVMSQIRSGRVYGPRGSRGIWHGGGGGGSFSGGFGGGGGFSGGGGSFGGGGASGRW